MRKAKETPEDIITDAPEDIIADQAKDVTSKDSIQDRQDRVSARLNLPYEPLTDIGNAERFFKRFGKIVKYCPEEDSWLVCDDRRWVRDSGKLRYGMAKLIIIGMREEAETREDLSVDQKEKLLSHADRSSSKGRIKAMFELAKWAEGITVCLSELDSDPWLINAVNGTLNLKTGKLQPHNPADLITKMVSVPYEPKAPCPEFDRFFNKITGGNQEKADFFHRASGYTLSGETGEQCLFILHGPGANGKSTITETFREILNDYAMHTTSDSLLHSKSSPIRNDIARLNGARFVSAVEVGMGKKLDEALIKQLTGGDQVTARFLYNEHFEYKPKFKLFISANHRPEIRGTDNGIWRRIHLIPFDVTIKSDEIDKELPNKLRQELPGIFAWMVRGFREWQSQGLNPPKCIEDVTAEYRAEMDTLSGFIEDKCNCQSSEKTPVSDLYIAYKGWSDDACQETVGKKIFGNLMRQKGYLQSKSDSKRYWNGIKLNLEAKPSEAESEEK
jgi:putative DNA primase/helicase